MPYSYLWVYGDMKKLSKKKKIILNIVIFLLLTVVSGFVIRAVVQSVPKLLKGEDWEITKEKDKYFPTPRGLTRSTEEGRYSGQRGAG